MEKLKAGANKRDIQRLNRLDTSHANAWLTARPSCTDGKDAIPPKIYRTAVAHLLGQPVYSNSAPCPFCKQTMDIYGDHSVCCSKTGDRITRHNRLRNLIFKLADIGSPLSGNGEIGAFGRNRPFPS